MGFNQVLGESVDILSIVLIAVGLSIDDFAISISYGIATTQHRKKSAIMIISFFTVFQMLMPLMGYFVGFRLNEVLMGINYWVAFGLLVFIGVKMIYDSTKKEAEQKASLKFLSLLIISIVTSVDALMVGFSFAFIQTEIFLPVLLIGIVTFLLSFGGFFFGCSLGRIFGNRMKVVGGLVLIAIGIRILIGAFI
jgi:putative Mn2+ efflux pump MntP